MVAWQLLDVPDSLKPELTRIATQWAGDQPLGWPQISAILTRLRTDYTLDPKAFAPASSSAPVVWFLTESRRGPDYLFATSATLLLRSLGYPTRFCLGYYAAPHAYDEETNHTPITKYDVHLWSEVLLKDGHWLVVEPTPGYDVLPPLLTWREWFTQQLAAITAFATRNGIALSTFACVVVVSVWKRRRLIDHAHTLAWKLRPGQTWQQRVLNATRVLDRRGSLAGRARIESHSLADWMQTLAPSPNSQAALRPFVDLAERAAYAPNLPPPFTEAEMLTICRQALRIWTLDQFVNTPSGVAA
jgi:protein-glutamine gamma-glutamyltransferase